MKKTIPLQGTDAHGRSGWFKGEEAIAERKDGPLRYGERGRVTLRVVSRKKGKLAPIILVMVPSVARSLARVLSQVGKPKIDGG